MKKHLVYVVILLTIIVNVGLVSCSNDDNNNQPTNSSIVGLWRHNFSSGYILICFNMDNTGYEQEYDETDGGLRRKHNFSYRYNEDDGHLLIVMDDGDILDYIVMYINKTEMELFNSDDGSDKYVRVN